MRTSDLALIASLFFVALADAALTYVIIVSGIGYEANPAWRIFNYKPGSIWSIGIASDMIAILLTAALLYLAYMSRLPAAVKIVRCAALAMVASRAVVVANNAAVLFLHVNLIPTNLFFS
jgi:hypothetical protein